MSALVIHKPKMVAANKLRPQSYNPRHITKRKFNGLKRNIRKNGFVEPLVVQADTFAIIGGHQRLKAVAEICKEDKRKVPALPCVVLDISDRDAKLLNIALNNLTGEFEYTMLGQLLQDIQTQHDFDPDELAVSGYTQAEIDKMIAKAQPPVADADDLKPFASSITLQLKFDSVEQRDTVRALLNERSQNEGKKSGTIVYGLLK